MHRPSLSLVVKFETPNPTSTSLQSWRWRGGSLSSAVLLLKALRAHASGFIEQFLNLEPHFQQKPEMARRELTGALLQLKAPAWIVRAL